MLLEMLEELDGELPIGHRVFLVVDVRDKNNLTSENSFFRPRRNAMRRFGGSARSAPKKKHTRCWSISAPVRSREFDSSIITRILPPIISHAREKKKIILEAQHCHIRRMIHFDSCSCIMYGKNCNNPSQFHHGGRGVGYNNFRAVGTFGCAEQSGISGFH